MLHEWRENGVQTMQRDCFEKETILLNFGENGDEKEKEKRGKEKIRDLKIL